jgi:hypothetical protein
MQTMGQLEIGPVYFVTRELLPLAMTCLRNFAHNKTAQPNHQFCFQFGLVCTSIMQGCMGAHQINAPHHHGVAFKRLLCKTQLCANPEAPTESPLSQ